MLSPPPPLPCRYSVPIRVDAVVGYLTLFFWYFSVLHRAPHLSVQLFPPFLTSLIKVPPQSRGPFLTGCVFKGIITVLNLI
jgi:hypothetical protein